MVCCPIYLVNAGGMLAGKQWACVAARTTTGSRRVVFGQRQLEAGLSEAEQSEAGGSEERSSEVERFEVELFEVGRSEVG